MQSIPITQINNDQASNASFPVVRVGADYIKQEAIAQEMQYHPSTSAEEAWEMAARSLVIEKLLATQAEALAIQGETVEEKTANLLEQELQLPEIREEDCLRYFEQNQGRMVSPKLISLKHILLAAAPDDAIARDQQLQVAKSLIEKLTSNPNSFTELAASYSVCESKNQGGHLGQISRGQTVAEFERQIWNLPIGLHQQPIESRYGYHLVYIDQSEEGQALPYEVAAPKIRQYLQENATRTALRHYLQALASSAPVLGIDMGQSDSPLVQ
ncbi:peptidylprolyl isomerase [Marinospirillum insulare]|uniref:peptidylprolyl isomerase n=1 Tax=Marinospirillum insulare TaxID=217169 RepID=A0ABQ5ZY63_9GAMM|nr:peptidylprolyl isomerase [Marinospirillum insulare]GLR64018.1 peptidylprolyl isomerase [Marinospirillum insulare]